MTKFARFFSISIKIIFILHFVMWLVLLIDLWMRHPCISEWIPFYCGIGSFKYVIGFNFLIFCWGFFHICSRISACYFLFFFFLDDVFGWLWYLGNTGFVKCIWLVSLSSFFKRIWEKIGTKSSLNITLLFTSKVIWSFSAKLMIQVNARLP